MAQAYGAASPVIHITGGVPLNGTREAFHGVDDPEFTHEMYKKVTKWSARIRNIEDIILRPGNLRQSPFESHLSAAKAIIQTNAGSINANVVGY